MKHSLKQLAKQISPPILWEAVRRLKVKPQSLFTCEGRFDSFETIYRVYPEATNYHSTESESAEYKSAERKLQAFKNGEEPEDSAHLTRLNFLPTMLCLSGEPKISILDVGGGLGTAFIDLMYCLQEKSISMTVVELPSVAARGAMLFKEYKEIEFADKMPAGGGRFDVVHFGSSLQYCQNYRETIKEAASLKPRILAISYTAMGPASTFVAAQLNMPGRVIPRMVFNKSELVNLVKQEGYRLVHQSVYFRDGISFSNYEHPINATRHWNIVFRRNADEQPN